MVSSTDATRIHERLDELFSEMRIAFHGDGSTGRPGLFVRLDRIEQESRTRKESRTIAIKALWTAACGAVATALLYVIHFFGAQQKP